LAAESKEDASSIIQAIVDSILNLGPKSIDWVITYGRPVSKEVYHFTCSAYSLHSFERPRLDLYDSSISADLRLSRSVDARTIAKEDSATLATRRVRDLCISLTDIRSVPHRCWQLAALWKRSKMGSVHRKGRGQLASVVLSKDARTSEQMVDDACPQQTVRYFRTS